MRIRVRQLLIGSVVVNVKDIGNVARGAFRGPGSYPAPAYNPGSSASST